jgi:hypothetical protein
MRRFNQEMPEENYKKAAKRSPGSIRGRWLSNGLYLYG